MLPLNLVLSGLDPDAEGANPICEIRPIEGIGTTQEISFLHEIGSEFYERPPQIRKKWGDLKHPGPTKEHSAIILNDENPSSIRSAWTDRAIMEMERTGARSAVPENNSPIINPRSPFHKG